jgi:phage shock protein E
MHWSFYFAIFGGLLVFMWMRRSGQIPKKEAEEYLRNGAIVIDVRNKAEFNSGHLSQAYNMPLDEVEGMVAERVQDKNKVLLLHCQSGVRSKKAKARLESIGYKNVFNLGSYERAFKIVTGRSL